MKSGGKAIAQATAQGGWQIVRRKKNYSTTTSSPATHSSMAHLYQPYQPSYAQMAALPPKGPAKTSPAVTPTSSPPSSRPSTPPTPPGTKYYTSPYSPTKLRFPPLSTYPEWRGRCFKCCRLGHNSARCRNARKCGKCWGDGHTAKDCKGGQPLNPSAKPFAPGREQPQGEVLFPELSLGPKPLVRKQIPGERPQKVYSFIDRDEEYFKELRRLTNSVVITSQGLHLSAEGIVDWAIATGLVHFDEVAVVKLKEGKYLLNLPEGLVPETFIRATPPTLWDQGVSFQQWTMLEEAAVNIPMFKVRLELTNVPEIHWRETEIIRAVSNFGIYLGTMWPSEQSCEVWTAVVAVDDLCRIPHAIVMVAGGLERDVMVDPVDWAIGPVYKRDDLPTLPPRFSKPATARPSPQVKALFEGEDMFPMSRRVLLDLCRGRDEETLPLVVKAALAGARSLAPYEGRQCDEAMNGHLTRLYQTVGQHEAGWRNRKATHLHEAAAQQPQKILLRTGEKSLQQGAVDHLCPQIHEAGQHLQHGQEDNNTPHEEEPHQIQNNPLFIPQDDSSPKTGNVGLSGGKRQTTQMSAPQGGSAGKNRQQRATGPQQHNNLGEAGSGKSGETGPSRRRSSGTPHRQISSPLGPTPVIRKEKHAA